MSNYVLETVDIDCDGIGYGWHRFEARTLPTVAEAMKLVSPGPVDGSRVLSIEHFEREVGCELSRWGREYWEEEGYASDSSSFEEEDRYEDAQELDLATALEHGAGGGDPDEGWL